MAQLIPKIRASFSTFSKDRKSAKINFSGYDLLKESDRLRSFRDNKWNDSHVRASDLARLGCYFFKSPDLVRCIFCYVQLSEFASNDDALKEHLRFSPNCPLLRRCETRNEPIDRDELERILPEASYDTCGVTERKRSRVEDEVAHPEYRLPSQRIKTFVTWPVALRQKPEDLVRAGFYYSGQSDYTICFSCGVLVGNWEPTDNPWVEHEKLLLKPCNYLKFNQEQLSYNKKQYERSRKAPVEQDPHTSLKVEEVETEKDFETLCKVCLENKSSIVILPCKHVAVCGQCIFGVGDDCPICRTRIEETINLIYS
jgi:baculoviral IAP repeat-containing protein 7/8